MQGLARALEQQFIIVTEQGQQRVAAKVFAPANVFTVVSLLLILPQCLHGLHILVALTGGCQLPYCGALPCALNTGPRLPTDSAGAAAAVGPLDSRNSQSQRSFSKHAAARFCRAPTLLASAASVLVQLLFAVCLRVANGQAYGSPQPIVAPDFHSEAAETKARSNLRP